MRIRLLAKASRLSWKQVPAPVLLALACLLFYWNLSSFTPVSMEDFPRMFSGSGPPGLKGWAKLFSSDYSILFNQTSLYRPMTTVFYRLGWSLFGANMAGYLWMKAFLFWACATLIYFLAVDLGLGAGCSLLGAAFFLFQPLHMGSFMTLSWFDDPLLCFFFLLAAMGHARLRRATKFLPAKLAWICAAYFCALLSKEPAIVLPVVLLLDDHLVRDSKNKARRWEYGLLVATTAAYFLLLMRNEYDIYSAVGLARELPWWAPLKRLGAYLVYLFPGTDYGKAVSLAGLALLLWIGIRADAKLGRKAAFCASWTLLALLPVINIISSHFSQVANYFLGSGILPARLELPSAGFSLLVAAAFAGIAARPSARWFLPAAAWVLWAHASALRASIVAENRHFDEWLLTADVFGPSNPLDEARLENVLLTLPVLRKAEPARYEALRGAIGRKVAVAGGCNVADFFTSDRIYSDSPRYAHLLNAMADKGMAGFQREFVLFRRGVPEDAEGAFARRIESASIEADEGVALYLRGDRAGARMELERALRHNGNNRYALISLGAVYMDEHRFDDALRVYNQAAKTAQNDQAFFSTLLSARSTAWEMKRDWRRAKADREQALRLSSVTGKNRSHD